jgi:hypothetical protein
VRQFVFLLVFFFASLISAGAQQKFDFNAACLQAYQEINKLKFETAESQLQKIRLQQPENLIPLLLDNYIDFYTLFFNEDPGYYTQRMGLMQNRLDALSHGDKASPFYLYSQSLIRLQRGAVQIKFGNFWDAGWDIRKAYLLIKENRKKFPKFSPNEMVYGALESVMGTIPKGYKWLTNLLGMRGSINEGMKKMKAFTNSNEYWARQFSNEACFIYPYLLFHIANERKEALDFVENKKLDLVNNHLHAFMAANLSLNNKDAAQCKLIILHRNKSPEYLSTPVWEFQLGYAQLYHVELKEAIHHFEQFTQQFKGKFYVKDSYQKISWAYYLQGNQQEAEANRKLTLTKGSTTSDADKKANRDAKENNWPNPLLLKARLLSDGGYHSEAYKLLQGKTSNDFSSTEDKLDFAYRAARIYDDLGRKDDAIKNYLLAIKLGGNRREHYAARAALQIGMIYEERGDKANAILYYQQCINMEGHEFKDSLDQKAKSGIARCKGN